MRFRQDAKNNPYAAQLPDRIHHKRQRQKGIQLFQPVFRLPYGSFDMPVFRVQIFHGFVTGIEREFLHQPSYLRRIHQKRHGSKAFHKGLLFRDDLMEHPENEIDLLQFTIAAFRGDFLATKPVPGLFVLVEGIIDFHEAQFVQTLEKAL